MSELIQYVSPASPNLNIGITVNDVRVQVVFEGHVANVDADTAEVLDAILAKQIGLRAKVQKVDREAAEAMAKAHAAKNMGGPAKGTMTSDMHKLPQKHAEALQREGATPEQVNVLVDAIPTVVKK